MRSCGRCLSLLKTLSNAYRPCINSSVIDYFSNRYNCTILDWLDIPQYEAGSTAGRTIAVDQTGFAALVLCRPLGPPLVIETRSLFLSNKADHQLSQMISLNALGIRDLGLAATAIEAWIKSCHHTYLEDMLEGSNQITKLCFQAAFEATSETASQCHLDTETNIEESSVLEC